MSPLKSPIYQNHLSTYVFATKHIWNKDVFEIGCGEGYGLSMLSMFAKSVEGWDVSKRFLNNAAKRQYFCPHLLLKNDIDTSHRQIPKDKVVVAFEVLEHIRKPHELVEYLYQNGNQLIFSVPHNYPHPLHLTNFYSLEDVKKLVAPYGHTKFFYLKDGVVYDTPIENPDRYIGITEKPIPY